VTTVLETSARLLRLLGMFQGRRDWTGDELAMRLSVTPRTIRKDVSRLRTLGYPVDARPGVAGGYRLGVGASLPPLLLDDDEAVAVAVGLRTAASGSVAGIEEASIRAGAKLHQVLPARLRRRVMAIQETAVATPIPGPRIDPDSLARLALACRDRMRLRFDYVASDERSSRREAEPHVLVQHRGRWYLVAWDLERVGWRVFRADRVDVRFPPGPRFDARPLPGGGDAAAYVAQHVAMAPWRFRARVVVHASAAHVQARLPVRVDIEALADDRCAFEPGSDDAASLAMYLGMLDADFEVVGAPELVAALEAMAGRYERAVDASRTVRSPVARGRRGARTGTAARRSMPRTP
jgi:predicted DNA-binding transcriptional regulator YafY